VGTILAEKLCDLCKHLHSGSHPPTCAAYPDRIPLEIRLMQVDHREPYPGDHGIRFEPVDCTAETLARVANLVCREVLTDPGELQRRVAAVLEFIPFPGHRERQLFGLAVRKTTIFKDLPEEAKKLILAGEEIRNRLQEPILRVDES
jgi:hypothetical protein